MCCLLSSRVLSNFGALDGKIFKGGGQKTHRYRCDDSHNRRDEDVGRHLHGIRFIISVVSDAKGLFKVGCRRRFDEVAAQV